MEPRKKYLGVPSQEFLVVVTFDLSNAESIDYRTVRERLAEIGLKWNVRGDGDELPRRLPENTFVGNVTGPDAVSVRAKLAKTVGRILQDSGHKDSYFISVGADWAWLVMGAYDRGDDA
jgi:hypothetical protein